MRANLFMETGIAARPEELRLPLRPGHGGRTGGTEPHGYLTAIERFQFRGATTPALCYPKILEIFLHGNPVPGLQTRLAFIVILCVM